MKAVACFMMAAIVLIVMAYVALDTWAPEPQRLHIAPPEKGLPSGEILETAADWDFVVWDVDRDGEPWIVGQVFQCRDRTYVAVTSQSDMCRHGFTSKIDAAQWVLAMRFDGWEATVRERAAVARDRALSQKE